MKNLKKALLVSLCGAGALTLSACGDKIATTDTYLTSYYTHFETLNYLTSASATDSEYFANMIDGLVENDNYGNIVPGLAESWTSKVNNDNTQTWTFTLRDDIKWYDYNGKEYADVVAQDWVDAAQYLLNPSSASETVGIMTQFVNNSDEYFNALSYKADLASDSETLFTDYGFSSEAEATAAANFDNVGVKAVDEKTLEYTIYTEAPYFLTALAYSTFLPVNGDYLKDEGPSFGLSQRNILVNGAYLMDKNTKDVEIILLANDDYWDVKNVHVKKVVFKFLTGDTASESRLLYESGQLTAFTVQDTDVAGWEKYVLGADGTGNIDNPANPVAVSSVGTSATQYYMAFNFNRQDFTKSTKNAAQQAATKVALEEADFRLGFVYGIDTAEFLAQYTAGEQWAKRTYTTLGLCMADGKDYVEFVYQEYADNNNMTFEEAEELLGPGADNIQNIEKAKAYFEGFKEDNPSLTYPIIVETVGSNTQANQPYYENVVKAFNLICPEIVKMAVVHPNSSTEWTELSNTKNSYDIRLFFGWGPDYADPLTFAYSIGSGSSSLAYMGLTVNSSASNTSTQAEVDRLKTKILGEYDALVKTANAITDTTKTSERYAAFAEAEYHALFEAGIIIPYLNVNGTSVIVSKIKPYTSMRAPYGLASDRFKLMEILEEELSAELVQSLKEEYEANRPS